MSPVSALPAHAFLPCPCKACSSSKCTSLNIQADFFAFENNDHVTYSFTTTWTTQGLYANWFVDETVIYYDSQNKIITGKVLSLYPYPKSGTVYTPGTTTGSFYTQGEINASLNKPSNAVKATYFYTLEVVIADGATVYDDKTTQSSSNTIYF
ncbi:MAG TPA: hypothetical protein VFB38_21155 [Chthonomonadaceae bacterium]|nr:hypothetical protein [Chthonomonadaceae bacterium]